MLAHLTEVSIRATALACAAAALLWIARRRWTAAFEHAVWTVVQCGMLAMLLAGAVIPKIAIRAVPAAPVTIAPAAVETRLSSSEPGPPAEILPVDASQTPPPKRIDASRIGVYVYFAVVLWLLARLALGNLLAWRLLVRSRPVNGFRESSLIAVPVTVGLLRPAVLLPEEWREWHREKLETVLAHEAAHVRRRDALVAALARVNRCLFWFHPLAWWLERRLGLLAELACDDACVASTGRRYQYANLLLEMGQSLVERHGRLRAHALPMASRSHLARRIEAVLGENRTFSRGLSRAAWALLAACSLPMMFAAGAVDLGFKAPLRFELPRVNPPSAPALIAQARPAPPPQIAPAPPPPEPRLEFEAASLRPSTTPADPPQGRGARGPGYAGIKVSGGPGTPDPERLTLLRAELRRLLLMAYEVNYTQVSGPGWMDSTRFDLEAKIPRGATQHEVNLMLQDLLNDRFKIALHRETKDFQAWNLVVAKGGTKIAEATASADASGLTSSRAQGAAHWKCHACAISDLILPLGLQVASTMPGNYVSPGRVIDQTNLLGKYDFIMEFTTPGFIVDALEPPPDTSNASAPDLLTALEKQLGLRLERTKAPMEVLVIDHVERIPSGN